MSRAEIPWLGARSKFVFLRIFSRAKDSRALRDGNAGNAL